MSSRMDLTNESYLIRLSGKTWSERYRKDSKGWLKTSARGNKFRMTAEQVLNHLLPALAGVKPGIAGAPLPRPARRRHAGARPAGSVRHRRS